MIAFALMLFSAGIAAWLIATGIAAGPRRYVRFASMLAASLAVAACLDPALARDVALIVAALLPVMLAAAAGGARPAVAAPAFALAAIAGIAAAMSGLAALAFAPLLPAALFIAAGMRPQLPAAALALVAGAASLVAGDARGLAALLAFFSVGVMGVALALAPRSDAAVEARHGLRGPLAIRRRR